MSQIVRKNPQWYAEFMELLQHTVIDTTDNDNDTTPGVVSVVLETSVDQSIVRRYETVLVTTVKIDSVGVEEQTILDEQEIHVDGHEEGDEEERRGSEELIHWLISDHREGRGIVEHVVMLVMLPEPGDKCYQELVSLGEKFLLLLHV